MPSRLFIASIGNPGIYYNTLHSAGHTMLDSLHAHLGYPAFAGNLAASTGQHALYRSSSLMNVSGSNVCRAYRRWLKSLSAEEQRAARLVVLHDELELQLGRVRFKSPGSSFRGHNGLKDVAHVLNSRDFARISVGIGRPESRDTKTVVDYVLRKTTPQEMEKMTGRTQDMVDMLETYANESG